MTSQGDFEQQPWIPAQAATEPVVQATQRLGGEEATQRLGGADAAHVPTVQLSAPAAGELRRFGPGVPASATIVDLSQATAMWRGEIQPVDGGGEGDAARRRRRRVLASWLLPLLVLIAVIAILLWQHSGPALTVTDVTVRAASPTLTCDGTATLTATLDTNGAEGTITYRWRRSDGTASDTLRQQAAKGSNDVHVVLLWSFHGQGTVNATATLDVLGPDELSASTTFRYSCN